MQTIIVAMPTILKTVVILYNTVQFSFHMLHAFQSHTSLEDFLSRIVFICMTQQRKKKTNTGNERKAQNL